ncbi:MAG: ABC transporter permease [Holophagales bacterium]|nr:ABC transporter permease [Holophagales bacterium]
MSRTWKDLRFALRTLRRNPGVTLLAVGSLALAIAGNTIVFSLINGLLYRPLPYEEPHRLSLIGERAKDLPEGFISPSSLASFLDWQEGATSYSGMAAFRSQGFGWGEGENLEQLTGAAVSTEFFGVLGVRPQAGRVFLDEEAVPGRDRVAIVSHAFWQERLGGRSVDGQTVELNGDTYDIVGVMAADFDFLVPDTAIYVPLAVDRGKLKRHQRDVLVVGRLAPGVSDAAARQEMSTIMARLEKEYPESNLGYAIDVLNLREEIPDRRNRLFFGMMQGALLFVLLIACANIANILLARSQRRETEMAVRSSLGASRAQLMGQLLAESMLMAVIAGALGLGLATVGNRLALQALSAQMPTFYQPVMDTRVLMFNLGVTLFGGILFSLAPILQTFRGNLLGSLKEGSKGSSGAGKRWASNALVVAELALALVFLAGAGVLLGSFQALQGADPGFETADLLTAQTLMPETRYDSDEARIAAVEQLEQRLGALPGVEGILISNTLPRHLFLPRDTFTVDGEALAADQAPPRTEWLTVSPGYFSTLGIQLEQGRVIEAGDRQRSEPVVVVNRSLAERFLGEGNPLGRRITLQGQSRRIVGVVEDVRHGLSISDRFGPVAYLPWAQLPLPSVAFVLRTDSAVASTLGESLRRELQAFDPHMAVTQVITLDAFIDQFWAGQRLFTVILRAFGGLALLLAAIGTYGVLAYSVAQRTREIGVRIAVGAERKQVVGMVLRQGLQLAGIGILLGIPGIWAVTRGLESVMAGFVPLDPSDVISGGVVLVVVTFFASLLPALRASGVDPSTALRQE